MNIGSFKFNTNSSQGRQQMQIHQRRQREQREIPPTQILHPRIPKALKTTGNFKFKTNSSRGQRQVRQEQQQRQQRQQQIQIHKIQQEQQRQEQQRQEQQRQEQQRQEQQRQEQQRQEQQRQEQLRQEQQRQKQLRQEQQRQEQQRQEQQRQEQQRQEQQRQEQQRQEQLRQEQLRQEQQRIDRPNINEYNDVIKIINDNHIGFEYKHTNTLKSLHRFDCFKQNKILRNIIIHEFGDKHDYLETLLIEFRPLPNLEFLIRNTIIKLPLWNHTIICGNINYNFIKNICDIICKNTKSKINIITLDIVNITPSEYSKLLTTTEFWERLKGEKILLYQEDTMLFHSNIDPFLEYDYIGAPWPENQYDNEYGVGNGGFSLRSKSKMIECIKTVNPTDLKLGQSTLDYMKNTDSSYIPEDVFFSKCLIDFKIGNVAKREIAKEFSQETQLSERPLGGHNFWLAENKLIGKYIKSYNLKTQYYKETTHRYGWGGIINNLIECNIVNNMDNFSNSENFIDSMESFFIWNKNQINDNWYGIMHYVNGVPNFYAKEEQMTYVLECAKPYFKYCKGIIALSESSKNNILDSLKGYGYDIPVYSLKHPIQEVEFKFNLTNFVNKENYKIIQLGQQYRKVSTIYMIKSKYDKIWLSGSKNGYSSMNVLKKELKYLNITPINNVLCYYTKTFEEFDNLLLNNIIIIPLWNASANNSLLECLEMNIPAFITRLDSTEEYLGKDYPMFYTDISEVEKVINNRELLHQKYEETHEYLLTIDKSDIRHEHFNSELLKIINV